MAAGQAMQFTATVTPNYQGVIWSVNGLVGGSPALGTIDANGNYTAPALPQSASVFVSAISEQDSTKVAYASISIVGQGQVTTTNNPQVALYTISPPGNATVSIQFGPDTDYGLTTWAQLAPSGGGPVSIYVAGMRASTEYHMRAAVQLGGETVYDSDHTFTTASLPVTILPTLTAAETPGMVPQSGVELLDLVFGTSAPTVADLAGNVLWTYTVGPNGTVPNPIKLLPNGHFLANFSVGTVDGQNSVLQEVDLGGNLIWQMNAADLNKALAAATCSGCNITVTGTHHDFVQLPNGHLIVIAGTQQVVSATTVTGDVLIDLDQNHEPVWLWNEFDHLDINRRPYMYPDWTHTNAVIYSPDDGNLIVSIRHQNWLVKVDYANGAGAGDVIWRLGYQGDFALVGGTDPTDWFYAQHGPSFASTSTTGKFSLVLFDNGDDRFFPTGQVLCAGPSASCYSTIPIFSIDENAKTATLAFRATAPFYSFFGGNAAVLANGNVEFCESAGGPTSNSGEVYEVMPDSKTQIVWQMQVAGQYAYRGQRIPSLYPGVQW